MPRRRRCSGWRRGPARRSSTALVGFCGTGLELEWADMSNDGQKISSLRDLPRDIAPPRDLWQGIEARIAAEKSSASADASAGATAGGSAGAPADLPRRRAGRAGGSRVWAAAAVFVALAVGIWIGRV